MGQLVRSLAAARQAKELFKTLQKVTVTANPFDYRSTTAREFLRRVRTPPVKRSNPKLLTELTITEEYGNPTIELLYGDGFQQKIQTSGLKIMDIMDEVERVARWKGEGVHNPFEELREKRAKILGLK
ncbi:unnamed protein product [Agarophyton chilense]